MKRYKGMSSKQALDANDLAELDDIYRRLQRLHGQLNPVSCQRFPLMAASATPYRQTPQAADAMTGFVHVQQLPPARAR